MAVLSTSTGSSSSRTDCDSKASRSPRNIRSAARKTVDLHAARGDERHFIEVETGHSDIIANATKCANLSGTIWFVFTDAHIRGEYAQQLQALLPAAHLITTAELHELR